MENQGTISLRQLTILAAFYVIGDSILVLPAFPVMAAKQDGWISGLLGMVVGIPLIYIPYVLARIFPNLTLFEYIPVLIGKWAGFVCSLLFLFYFFMMAAVLVREVGDFLTTQIMPETPIQAILILFLAIVVFGARLGLETISRTGELLFFVFVSLFIILTLCITPQIRGIHLEPVLEGGMKPIIHGAITTISFPFLEMTPLFFVLPQVKKAAGMGSSIVLGVIIGGLALNTLIALSILVLDPTITSAQMYPSYSLAKKIDVAHFLTRMEAMLAIMWIITIYIKTTISFYALTVGFKQLLKLQSSHVLTLPFSMILLVISIVCAPNITYYNEVIGDYWPYMDWTVNFMIPLMLLGIYLLRKKKLSAQ